MPNKTLSMKALRNTALAILFLMACLSIWFYRMLKTIKEQTTKSNILTASIAKPSKDWEARLATVEGYFEEI